MSQQLTMTLIHRPEPNGEYVVLGKAQWRWGGYTTTAISYLREAYNAIFAAVALEPELTQPGKVGALAEKVLLALGGQHLIRPDDEIQGDPVWALAPELHLFDLDDSCCDVEVDLTDPINPGFWAGGAFMAPTLKEELENQDDSLANLLEEGTAVILTDPREVELFKKVRDGGMEGRLRGIDLQPLGALVAKVNGGDFGFILTEDTEDSDTVLTLI